mmetsp:Transcript_17535/g.48861  ORF Transcript_17535/g.48861 Transcript_17535/m.48861 type:complete len:101 (-) Transcript_17535:2925-3227(-)
MLWSPGLLDDELERLHGHLPELSRACWCCCRASPVRGKEGFCGAFAALLTAPPPPCINPALLLEPSLLGPNLAGAGVPVIVASQGEYGVPIPPQAVMKEL